MRIKLTAAESKELIRQALGPLASGLEVTAIERNYMEDDSNALYIKLAPYSIKFDTEIAPAKEVKDTQDEDSPF